MWPNGAMYSHCGGAEKIYRIKPNPEKRVRHWLRKCGHCRNQFTATVGTIFEGSERHPLRYVAEFDFRPNNWHTADRERADAMLARIVGERITYRDSLAA